MAYVVPPSPGLPFSPDVPWQIATGGLPTRNLPTSFGQYPVPTGNLPVLHPGVPGNALVQMADDIVPYYSGARGMGALPPGTYVPGGGATPRIPGQDLVHLPGMGSSATSEPGFVRQLATDVAETGGITGAAKSAGSIAALRSALAGIPFPKSTVGKVGLGLGLSVAGNVAGNALGGDSSSLGRFAKGAGTAGGFTAMFGPEVAVPAAAIGGIANAIFGGKKHEGGSSKWLEDDTLDKAGYSEQEKAQIKTMYEVLKSTTDGKTAAQQIGQIIIQDLTTKQQATQQEAVSQKQMLASQALAAQFFQPFTQQLLDSAQQRYAITEKVADDLPAGYRSVARAQNAASLDNATRVANAYQSQAQLLPALATMQYQKGLADQLSQQQAAQVMANLYGSGAGGGSSSLTDLASQMALQQQQQGG